MKLFAKRFFGLVFSFVLTVSLFSGALFSSPNKAQAIEGETDAYCLLSTSSTSYWYFTSWRQLHEWWRPTHNQLNEFWMVADSSHGGSFTLNIKSWLTGNTIVSNITAPATGSTYGWIQFDFANVAVTPGELYYVSVTGQYPNRWWFHTPNDCNVQNTTLGLTQNGTLEFHYDQDFIFAVYGQNAEAPPVAPEPDPAPPAAPPSTDPASTGDPGGVTATSEQPAAATTDAVANLEPPTNVAASDLENDQGGTTKLSWKKSTSTVTGYNLYRSTSKDKSFVKIATLKKSDETYNDSGAETGTTYYYYLRSYISSGESKNSQTINTQSVDNLAPATPVTLTAKFDADGKVVNLKWKANTELDLAGYIIKFGTDETNLAETAEVGKAATSAKLTRLKSTGNYFIQVSAKDTHNNISSPAKVTVNVTKASDDESLGAIDWKKTLTSPLGIGGIILIVLLAGVLTYLFIQGKKKKIAGKTPEKVVEKAVEDKPVE